MATETGNYKFQKPEETDFYDISVYDDFLDTLDGLLINKVDKVSGKGLSANDYTIDDKNKLKGIAPGANNYTHPSSHPASMITESSSRRFTNDSEKSYWNTKADRCDLDQISAVSLRGIIWKGDQSEFFHFDADTSFAKDDFFLIVDGYYEYFVSGTLPQTERNGTVLLGFHTDSGQAPYMSYSYINTSSNAPYNFICASVHDNTVRIWPQTDSYQQSSDYKYHVTKVAILNIK